MCRTHLGDSQLPFCAKRLTTHLLKWRGREQCFRQLNQGMIRCQIGNLARTSREPPTLCEECHGIVNDHSESGHLFNVSPERRRLLQHSVPITALGLWGYFPEGRSPPTGPPTPRVVFLAYNFWWGTNHLVKPSSDYCEPQPC